MPYKRRFRKRRRPARKAVDRKQNKMIRTLFRKVKKEVKWIDQSNTMLCNANWLPATPRPLTYITQGDGNDNRVANKVNLKGIQFKGRLTVNDGTNVVRLLVVKFGRTLNTGIQIQEVLVSANDPSPLHLLSLKKRNGTLPYKILYDRTILLAGNGTANSSTGPASQKNISFYLNMKDMPVSFDNDTDTLPSNGYIYVIVSSDSIIGGPTMSLKTRVTFTG